MNESVCMSESTVTVTDCVHIVPGVCCVLFAARQQEAAAPKCGGEHLARHGLRGAQPEQVPPRGDRTAGYAHGHRQPRVRHDARENHTDQ